MMLRLSGHRDLNVLLALAALEDGFLLLLRLVVMMRLECALEEALVLGEGFFALCVEGCRVVGGRICIGIWIGCSGETY
jgi:hypothetical protein